MDIELRKILDKVYANKMKPDEAQWKITILFNIKSKQCNTNYDSNFLRDKIDSNDNYDSKPIGGFKN